MTLIINQTIIVILAFIKLNYYLRIFENFSFLVSMMQGVFTDLKYFAMFYGMVVLLFASLFSILTVPRGEAYEGISVFGHIIMAFRTSVGDFELDEYKGTPF